MVDVEPDQVIRRLTRELPLMRERLQRLHCGLDAELVAAMVVRVAVSRYLVRSDDQGDFLAQLRHAARVKDFAPPLGELPAPDSELCHR